MVAPLSGWVPLTQSLVAIQRNASEDSMMVQPFFPQDDGEGSDPDAEMQQLGAGCSGAGVGDTAGAELGMIQPGAVPRRSNWLGNTGKRKARAPRWGWKGFCFSGLGCR